MISKLLVITDGCRFCNIKETDNNKYIIYVGSHFSLGSTAQPKLFVISRILNFCNQPNLSRIFSLRDNSANPNISRIFSPTIRFFFRLQIRGLLCDATHEALWVLPKKRPRPKMRVSTHQCLKLGPPRPENTEPIR